MSSNFQGRKRGKSVSFRGQSNDSNFYDNRLRNDNYFNENRQRNQYRDQSHFEAPDQFHNDIDKSRVVKLLPDANMTISVQNNVRGSNRGRSRGSRGILKSHSFRDDTNLQNRSSEFNSRSSEFNNRSSEYSSRSSEFNNRSSEYSSRSSEFNNRSDFNNRSSDYMEDYNPSPRRGFETQSFQSNRSRGRARGFNNRTQHASKFQEFDQEIEGDREFNHNNDNNFRGRSKSASDRNRRGRGSRGRGRGRSYNRTSDDHTEGPTSGDGDKEDPKDINNLESDSENKTNENEETKIPIISENCETPFEKEENNKPEIPKELNECSVTLDTPESSETVTKLENNREKEELDDETRETEVQ